MNFFETLIHPDREELELKERAVVIRAANLLQVGEFQLLQLAYREWFGHDLPEALVARLFATYMLHNDVPHWARHYARDILDRHACGEVDDADPVFHRYDHDYHKSVPRGVQRFCLAVAAITMCIGGSIVIANMSVGRNGSILPPYFDERDFKPAMQQTSLERPEAVPPRLGLAAEGGQP